MSDLFPVEPKTTNYSVAFEACWKVHPVGVKKAAWKAGEKLKWSEGNWVWLTNYLQKRHREDAKWLEGKYVPHLSSIINGERWTDIYKKHRLHATHAAEQAAEQEAQLPKAKPETVRSALDDLRRTLH